MIDRLFHPVASAQGPTRGARRGRMLRGLALAALALPLAACQMGSPTSRSGYALREGSLVTLQAGTVVPYGYATRVPLLRPVASLGVNFEFVERGRGYDLNALVFDTSGQMRRTAIRHCGTIDLDAFDESSRSLFGTPVLCDGRSYAFDTIGDRVAVVGPGRSYVLRELPHGQVLVNGVPLQIGQPPRPRPAPHALRAPNGIPFTILE